MQKQEAEIEFEKQVKEHELLLRKVCRIYAYTDADMQDLSPQTEIMLWKACAHFKGNSKLTTWL